MDTNGSATAVVLIVDDDAQMRESLAAFLSTVLEEGAVLTAATPDDAFEMIQEHAVNIVLSDHRMPQATGFEVLQRVREIDPEIGRLLMTGAPESDLAKRALNEGGVHRFFTKPLDPDEVLEAIETILEPA